MFTGRAFDYRMNTVVEEFYQMGIHRDVSITWKHSSCVPFDAIVYFEIPEENPVAVLKYNLFYANDFWRLILDKKGRSPLHLALDHYTSHFDESVHPNPALNTTLKIMGCLGYFEYSLMDTSVINQYDLSRWSLQTSMGNGDVRYLQLLGNQLERGD